jgi:hypothetical protein
LIQRRAHRVLGEAVDLLERIVDDTLLDAIADGTFGIMKRPADRGRGLDGVAAHEVDYYNPATEILEDTRLPGPDAAAPHRAPSRRIDRRMVADVSGPAGG